MKRTFATVLGLALAGLGLAQAQPELEKAQEQASQASGQAGKAVKGRQDRERLKRDLRYIAEELDRELLGPKANARDSAVALKARIAGLRARGNIDPRLGPVLDRLDALYGTLDQRQHIDYYVRSFMRAVTEELRWAAENAKDEASLLATLDEDLDVPIDAEAFFPEDVPLAKWRKVGPIKMFLVKHRIKRPKQHAATNATSLIRNKHNVQVGVEIEGVVTHRSKFSVDGDTTFDIGSLHIEVTPEWRLVFGRSMPIPNVGDKVRLKGWTYYDGFHKAEEEYDAADPLMGQNRKTLWEIHPLQDVVILAPAPGSPAE